MKKILIAVIALVLTAAAGYAADESGTQATEPVGAVVEAGGVFVGTVSSVVADAVTGGKGTVTVADEKGQTKIFPIDETVKVIDTTLNAVTFNQLKTGEKVEVQYSKASTGEEKASSIKVMQ